MEQTFYSNGKLLLSGEYVVLDGAKALGLPTAYGQYLKVTPTKDNTVSWRSLDHDGSTWYEDEIPMRDILKGATSEKAETTTLLKILHIAHTLNPNVLTKGYRVETQLTFPRRWGLGSSSTLINNIALWFAIDPYQLLWKSFGGSGYDIACARNNTPIIYAIEDSQPTEQPVAFTPPFKDHLWFVYLNKKQNSRRAIENYRARRMAMHEVVQTIDALTEQMQTAPDMDTFCEALQQHEKVMGQILGLTPVKESLFADFDGTIKSLGAWGGDFVIAASKSDPTDYFRRQGYATVIPYRQMILK